MQAHSAPLQIAFYDAAGFPANYKGSAFVTLHGSWNRAQRTGYKVVRLLFDSAGKATGEYEDFMTGFVVSETEVWGRPVGVAIARDGSLFVSETATGRFGESPIGNLHLVEGQWTARVSCSRPRLLDAFRCGNDRHGDDFLAIFSDRADYEPAVVLYVLRQIGCNRGGLQSCFLRPGQNSSFFILVGGAVARDVEEISHFQVSIFEDLGLPHNESYS
jgi:hypothetical protein